MTEITGRQYYNGITNIINNLKKTDTKHISQKEMQDYAKNTDNQDAKLFINALLDNNAYESLRNLEIEGRNNDKHVSLRDLHAARIRLKDNSLKYQSHNGQSNYWQISNFQKNIGMINIDHANFDEISEDHTISIEMVKQTLQNGYFMNYSLIPDKMKANHELFTLAMNGYLQQSSGHFKAEECPLNFAPEKYRDNKDLILQGMKKNPTIAKLASDRLKNDRVFISKIAKEYGYIPGLFNDKAQKDKALIKTALANTRISDSKSEFGVSIKDIKELLDSHYKNDKEMEAFAFIHLFRNSLKNATNSIITAKPVRDPDSYDAFGNLETHRHTEINTVYNKEVYAILSDNKESTLKYIKKILSSYKDGFPAAPIHKTYQGDGTRRGPHPDINLDDKSALEFLTDFFSNN